MERLPDIKARQSQNDPLARILEVINTRTPTHHRSKVALTNQTTSRNKINSVTFQTIGSQKTDEDPVSARVKADLKDLLESCRQESCDGKFTQ